jgi:tetratricopeptide (TPR) repeat protein
VEAAQALGDPGLLVRALDAEAAGLRMLGDDPAALARYTRILALAEDPSARHRLDGEAAASAVFRAHVYWVECALFTTGIPHRELFAVLDAADAWLAATGRRDWRAGVLLERALLHRRLGQTGAAVAAAEEALAAHRPGAPGSTLAGCRFQLGDILREAGRHADAEPHYRAILDDPAATAYDRKAAHQGLARCAVAAGRAGEARGHADAAVALAEPLGDESLCTALDALVAACRAAGNLDAARRAADRYVDAARRVGGHYRPYYAVRAAVDVALDRADLDVARGLLADLDRHATALDKAGGTIRYTAWAAERRRRLAEVEDAQQGQTPGYAAG